MGKKSKTSASKKAQLPTRAEILEFIQTNPNKTGKREIARAFHIKGAARIGLKRLLKEMTNEGLIEGTRKVYREPGTIAKVTVIEIIGQDNEGDYFGKPTKWDEGNEGAAPKVLIGAPKHSIGRSKMNPPGVGDHLLAHIDPLDIKEHGYAYSARPIKVLPRDKRRLLGIFSETENGGSVEPIDKKQLRVWAVGENDISGARNGELVSFEIISRGRFGPARVRIIDCLGNPEDEGALSLIAIEVHGLPNHFSEDVLSELKSLPALSLEGRSDLRELPLITIDPADARDHDDAVFAEADADPKNPGGFVVVVAIADVAFYVRFSSDLDREAFKRSNSVYFPDRVVPMLPELISNDLCSLKEGVDRPALAVRMVFDKSGRKLSHKFSRVLMKSAASLSYEQTQAAIDGRPDKATEPLLEPVIKPLWQAYRLLSDARDQRGPLELDLPERKIQMDDKGGIKSISIPERLDAHRLIEEFMIQANVAAAETLEAKKTPLIYRIHDAPSEEKIRALKEFLGTLEIKASLSGNIRPKQFNGILGQAKGREWQELVTEVVLRSQAQAEYSPLNLGHFGLNLRRYAHFTSPIRRYADLVVHRALISTLGLSSKDGVSDGLAPDQIGRLEEIAEQISQNERRASLAERETIDRLVARHLKQQEGAEFQAKISGVIRSGIFVRLNDTGADGFIPASSLHDDYYVHDEVRHALIGERGGATYHLGQKVDVRLVEVVPSAGAMRFEMLSDGVKGEPKRRKTRFQRKSGKKPRKGSRPQR